MMKEDVEEKNDVDYATVQAQPCAPPSNGEYILIQHDDVAKAINQKSHKIAKQVWKILVFASNMSSRALINVTVNHYH